MATYKTAAGDINDLFCGGWFFCGHYISLLLRVLKKSNTWWAPEKRLAKLNRHLIVERSWRPLGWHSGRCWNWGPALIRWLIPPWLQQMAGLQKKKEHYWDKANDSVQCWVKNSKHDRLIGNTKYLGSWWTEPILYRMLDAGKSLRTIGRRGTSWRNGEIFAVSLCIHISPALGNICSAIEAAVYYTTCLSQLQM